MLIVLPLSWLVYYAFTDKSGAFTVGNFHRLVSDAAYLDPLLTTFALATLSSLICCAVAAPMGWLVARTDMPLRRTIRILVMASFVTPPFLGAIAWELLAAPNSGLLNQLYREITGAPPESHLLNIYSFAGLVFVISCYTFPYVFVLVANALDRTPGDLEDASAILGGGTWDTARRITIPLALPAVLAGALVAFLQAMTLFGSPAILAMPAGFHTITTKIWSLFQFPPKPELAAAASLPLLVLTVMLLRAEHMVLGRRGYSVVGGKNSEPRIVKLGGWRWAMLAAAMLVLMCPVFLPYFALFNASFSKVASHLIAPGNFTMQNVHFVFFELSATPLALRNTFILGILAATCGTVLALVISLRHHAPGGRRLSRTRLPCHRAGRHSRHRARRRTVLHLYAAAFRALRHPMDSADRLRHAGHAGGLSAIAIGVPLGASRAGGRQPHPGRDAPARALADHRAAAAHQRDRHLVLHLRRRHPRIVGGDHAVHLADQGAVGAHLRSQRKRRPRRHFGARPLDAGDHLHHRGAGQ